VICQLILKRLCQLIRKWKEIGRTTHLLLPAENTILCRLGDAEFDNGLGRNLDLLLRLRVKALRAFLFCFTSLPKPGKINSPFFLLSL
jgi:hypothetical protein